MITLTLLTQPHCAWCDRAKQILTTLSTAYPLQVTEVDLRTDEGHRLAAGHRLLLAPGLLRGGRLIACGRVSEKALRRELPKHATRATS